MNSVFSGLRLVALTSSGFVALAATSGWAQNVSATAAGDSNSTDIIVTANRVESLASKTPVALTAISGEGLRQAGVTQPINLVEQVPGLAVNRSRGGLNFTVRGVASSDTSEKGDSSTAFLLDGVYIGRAPMQDASFFDVSRVEVLRGPQGTLYGRNTTAGAINVISNRPTFDFGGSVDGTYGNYDNRQLTGVINVPVNDNIALRGAVNYEHNGSFVRGGPLVNPSYKKFREILGGRLSALFKWDSGELVVRGDYADIGGSYFNALPLANFYRRPSGVGATPAYIANGRSTSDLLYTNVNIPWPMYRNNSSWGVTADLTQDLGPLTFFYLGSYREMDRDEQGAFPSGNLVNGSRTANADHFQQQSHELRVALNDSDKLKLQAGAYYFAEKSDVQLKINVSPNTTPNGEAGTTLLFDLNPTKARSYAVFTQGTYSLTDTLRVTAGIRYTKDKKTRFGYGNVVCTNNFFNCTVPAGAFPTERASFKSSKATWRAGLEYDAGPTTLIYGTVSTGYKAGGFNNGCVPGTGPGCTVPADALYFAPETLTSYEAGVKSRFLENKLQISASAFHYDYSDLQLTQVLSPCPASPNVPTSACTFTTSAAKAKIDGAELEGTVTPSALDRFDFSVAYLKARYDEYVPRAGYDFSGQPLNRAPRWTVSAGYQHSFPIGDYELVAGARTRLSSAYYLLYEGGLNFYRQPSYTNTDLTLTLNAPGKRWYLQGFVKNVENSLAVNNVTSGSFSFLNVTDPRTYGVRAGFKF